MQDLYDGIGIEDTENEVDNNQSLFSNQEAPESDVSIDEPEQVGDNVSHEDETESHEENSEQHSDEHRQKNPIKQRFNKIIREKNEALRYAQDLNSRNSILESKLMELAKRAEVSDKAAITHYDTVLNRELEQASKEHSRALSEGDYESATEAQKKIAAATAKIEQAKSWEAQENWRNEQENIRRQQEQSLYEKQAQEQEYIINQENNARLQNTEAWVSKNPWYNEGSKDYNPDLFNKVEEFTEELEEYFHSRGESYLIGSGTYFKAIDKKVSELSNNSPKRSISMSRNNYMSTPVRSSSQSKQTSSPLTPLQKQYAKMFGASEADYVKNRKHDIDNGKAYSHGRAVGRMQNSFKI